MVRFLRPCVYALSIAILAGTAHVAFSQTEKPTASRKDSDKKKKKGDRAGRLPDYWTKLDLSEEQKDKIRAIDKAGRSRIQRLKAEIRQIEQEVDRDQAKVLTAAQAKQLEVVKAEAEKSGEIKKTKAKKSGSGKGSASSKE